MGLHIHNKSMPYMYDPEEIYLLFFLLMCVKSFFRVPHHWQRVFSSPFLLTPAGHRCLPVCETDILWKNIKLPARTKSQDQNRNSAQTCETGLFVCLTRFALQARKARGYCVASCCTCIVKHCQGSPGSRAVTSISWGTQGIFWAHTWTKWAAVIPGHVLLLLKTKWEINYQAFLGQFIWNWRKQMNWATNSL